MTSVFNLVANHTLDELDLTADPFSVRADGASLGAAIMSAMVSKAVDSRSVRAVGAKYEDRTPTWTVGIDAATQNAVTAAYNDLVRMIAQLAKRGGVFEYRPSQGSYLTKFVVVGASVGELSLQEFEAFSRGVCTIALLVEPLGRGESPTVLDTFTTDSLADYTFDAGSSSICTVSGGVLIANGSLTTERRAHYTRTPAEFKDGYGAAKFTPGATITSFKGGIQLQRSDSSTRIEVYVDDTGAASRLRIDTVQAGVATNRESTNLGSRIVNGTPFWIEAWIEDGFVYANHWSAAPPTPRGTATTTESLDLDGVSLVGTFGAQGSSGSIGWIFTPQHASASMDCFQQKPFFYRSWTLPDVLPLNGPVDGTADARLAVSYTNSGASFPIWLLYAVWPKEPAHNFVWNDGFEVDTNGWVVTAVAGVTVAATSITRVTTAALVYEGAAAATIVCPTTTADTGASFAIYRKFKKGVTYTARCRIITNTGETDNVRIKLGVSSDIATGTNTALSASWVTHTVAWTPAADASVAYFVAGVQSSVASTTTFSIDQVMVFEGATAPTFTAGGYGPGIIEAASVDVTNKGSYFSITADADYKSGQSLQGSGSLSTNATAEWYLHPWLFTPDEYGGDYCEAAVIARLEIGSGLTALTAVTSLRAEGGTTYGDDVYTGYRDSGKALTLPSSGTVFRTVYLGTLPLRVDRANPRRVKLRTAFTSSGTGVLGIDYIAVVPARRMAHSRTGCADDAAFPDVFLASTESTYTVDSDLVGRRSNPASRVSTVGNPAAGLTNNRLFLPEVGPDGDGNRMLVLPSDVVVDLTTSATSSNTKTYTGTVQVDWMPMFHMAAEGS